MKIIPILNVTIFTILFLSATNSNGQENAFKLSAQYRARSEFRNGYRTLTPDAAKPAFFIAQRARLLLSSKKDKISSKISIQDARTWGDEEQKKDFGGLQVNELWVELALKKGFSLKMGRQELVYYDHRLLGNLDWGNLTISHDAMLLKYVNTANNINWHIGGAFNQVGEPFFGTDYGLKNYKFLGLSWFKKSMPKVYSNISFLGILNGLNSTDANSESVKTSITFGPLYNYQREKIRALLSAYYQTGKTENNLSINAYMFNAYGEYRCGKILAGLGFDYLSGNSDKTSANKSHDFSTLYATNHKFYGFLDYFLNIPADSDSRGLRDAYLRFGVVQNKKTRLILDVHHFSLAHENNAGANRIEPPLGVELDLSFDYKHSELISLYAGYSMMFAADNMEYIKGGNKERFNGWAFVMLNVTPVFFTHDFSNK
jgi:hypothetical protein